MVQNLPPYTPIKSLSHELGIMFAFIAACLAVVAVYAYFWRIAQHRNAEKELARRKELHARGLRREGYPGRTRNEIGGISI
ncbi:hypothetical protein ASPZODRAFT_12045 [Penicilliopsis zonata CBS 506.65]|uniref:Uncharacterized protein n=1 Tax=Penicilliopsis zonata CBS 506.65 TaxID=1073090 RepID=A0A1L9SVI9_9EURO|nr:hypothetical protein ASPZODRAFT_12045 [Penicilliopsis zonata CBS 506.65]OJJ51208.1 hypothetical protein ASPZODRAFT_12045 [Penicilliopsis zonata CBS 506.65]